MGAFAASLVAGVLSNLISDSVETGVKYVLSNREMDMELRRSVNLLEKQQLNIEGIIERLVNNQELLISILSSIIEQYHLQSQVYVENQEIVIVTNPNDHDCLKMITCNSNSTKNAESDSVHSDVFKEYYNYVRKMRGND